MIDRDGVPRDRRSRTYCLVTSEGKHYPPKYVLELAWRQTGRRIGSEDHLGGKRKCQRDAGGSRLHRCALQICIGTLLTLQAATRAGLYTHAGMDLRGSHDDLRRSRWPAKEIR